MHHHIAELTRSQASHQLPRRWQVLVVKLRHDKRQNLTRRQRCEYCRSSSSPIDLWLTWDGGRWELKFDFLQISDMREIL
eukprot:263167-Hanusia_phi.AAC.2